MAKHITLLLSLYFMVFSMLPQNYTFMEKVLSFLEEELVFDQPGLELEDNSADTKEDKKPPTLVEEDLYHCELHPAAFYLEVNTTRYYHFNENCKGLLPGIPLPPPDLCIG